ncbi:DnaJ domain-containing protein [Methylomicrobium lacus]|uniref:DnaJ domain-containing protein n=1 Tax=Methylomicrobium lacus TaxID=136992 RepID=UPI0035A8802E
MDASTFIDYYESLELSPNADAETIDRLFRYLAQRYHPDNRDTGDHIRYREIVRAHETLSDPGRRTQYDVQHKNYADFQLKLTEEASDPENIEHDVEMQEKLLAILYAKRRRNIDNPGIGNLDLERLSGCPREHLEFHLWYLKEKGWIGKLENGLIAITVDGIDHANAETEREATFKLLTDQINS